MLPFRTWVWRGFMDQKRPSTTPIPTFRSTPAASTRTSCARTWRSAMRRRSCSSSSETPGLSCSTRVLPRTRSSSRCAGPSIRSSMAGWLAGWLAGRLAGWLAGWLAAHPHPEGYGLLVLHTHSHTDHTAADGQFADRPGTVVVGAKRDAAWPYFGFADAPESVVQVDLGGRVLDCLATPGHHEAAVTYYDRYSGILFTGDTVYPGRLYVFDWPGFVRSIDRLVDWCAQRRVSYLLGCHIEMTTTPGVDYPAGWSYQPDETSLELTTGHLGQIQTTLKVHDLQPGRYVLPQMIITPVG